LNPPLGIAVAIKHTFGPEDGIFIIGPAVHKPRSLSVWNSFDVGIGVQQFPASIVLQAESAATKERGTAYLTVK